MTALKLVKTTNGVIPLCAEDNELIQKMKIGTVVECDYKQKRNSRFQAVKNFDVFRKYG